MLLYITEKLVCHYTSLQVCHYISQTKIVCHSTSLHEYVTICSTLCALPKKITSSSIIEQFLLEDVTFSRVDDTFFTRLNCVLWQFWCNIRKYYNPGIIQSMSAYITRQTRQSNGHCKQMNKPLSITNRNVCLEFRFRFGTRTAYKYESRRQKRSNCDPKKLS